jgi:uncharacterized protein
MNLTLSRYHVATPPVLDQTTGDISRIVLATRTAEARIVAESIWQAICSRAFSQLAPETLADLQTIELLVPDTENELSMVIDRNETAALNPPNLYLVIQPTAACQLGCGYCGQLHTSAQLKPEDQARLVDRVRHKIDPRRHKNIEIGWFGAEPLIGLPVIRALTPAFQQIAAEVGVGYLASVVTNGLLLDLDLATELVINHGVTSIEITLDGLAKDHDVRRHYKGGRGSFAKIYHNLVNVASSDLPLELSVRCNVDRRNVEGVSPLIFRLAEDGLQKRIRFYCAPIHSWGNDAHMVSLTHEEFAARELQWFSELHAAGFAVNLVPDIHPIVCMVVQRDADLVDATGTLYNCTEVSYVPAYGQPNQYAIGDLQHGEEIGKRSQLGNFTQEVRAGAYPCASCRMLPVCGGACPKLWKEGHVPCPPTKYNIESRLLITYAWLHQAEFCEKP